MSDNLGLWGANVAEQTVTQELPPTSEPTTTLETPAENIPVVDPVTNVGSNTATITWNSNSNVSNTTYSAYTYRYNSPGQRFNASISGKTAVFSGLPSNSLYHVVVTFTNAYGTSVSDDNGYQVQIRCHPR